MHRRSSNHRVALSVLPIAALMALAGCTSGGEPVEPPPTTAAVVGSTTAPAPTTTVPVVAPPSSTTTSSTTTTIPIEEVVVTLTEVDDGFESPVLLVASPDGGADLVVEQAGRVVRADGDRHEVVLDITDEVAFGGERGLLGLAVHPEFDANGLVYVNYTNNAGDTVVDQYEMAGGVMIPGTRGRIIRIEQPAGNHNGGMIAFGPRGNLWIGMGDGGGRNDTFRTGQRADSLLGSMLRLAVGDAGADGYAIPDDNPFASGGDGLPEVWAIGLRNPWRFAIDGDSVWIADVGQGRVEEINVADAHTPALNFGWSLMEGSECFRPSDCDSDGLVLPISEYHHDEGCSVTGGVVYRGEALRSLTGQFFYSDVCSGFLASVSVAGDEHDWTSQVGAIARPTGFGTGADGELYIVTQGGSLLRLEPED